MPIFTPRIFLGLIGLGVLLTLPTRAPVATRLFLLAGQSNMANLAPEISFVPALKKTFPNDDPGGGEGSGVRATDL